MEYQIFLLKGIIGGLIGVVVLMMIQYIYMMIEFDKIKDMLKGGKKK